MWGVHSEPHKEKFSLWLLILTELKSELVWFDPKTSKTFTVTLRFNNFVKPDMFFVWFLLFLRSLCTRLSLFLFFSLWFQHCAGCWLNSRHTVSTTYLVHHGRKKPKIKKHNSPLLERNAYRTILFTCSESFSVTASAKLWTYSRMQASMWPRRLVVYLIVWRHAVCDKNLQYQFHVVLMWCVKPNASTCGRVRVRV